MRSSDHTTFVGTGLFCFGSGGGLGLFVGAFVCFWATCVVPPLKSLSRNTYAAAPPPHSKTTAATVTIIGVREGFAGTESDGPDGVDTGRGLLTSDAETMNFESGEEGACGTMILR